MDCVTRVHDLGGPADGPPVLLLHANGFHSHVFEPMLPVLTDFFRVRAIDLPGHGDAWRSGPSGADVGCTIDLLSAWIDAADLRGRCLCLGHSLGGALALAAEGARPGLFAAVFAYEPVAAPAAAAAARVPARAAACAALAAMATRRRADFGSRDEAAARLGGKPPFSAFDPAALRAYISRGLRPGSAADGGASSSGVGAAGWTLKCSPQTEAAWFMAVGECVGVAAERVRCPVVIAVGRSGGGGGGNGSRSGGAVEGGGGGSGAGGGKGGGGGGVVHSHLPLLGEQLAEALPHVLLRRYGHLTHFGPLEAPREVAGDARLFFEGVLDARRGAGGDAAPPPPPGAPPAARPKL
ncbi:MAG: Alpha/Beta hydrolase protein [Monoraphidium minutum]|nr:MAG: Alpha/Beta hydrolase protein [Monoraphidium minutum]